MSYYTSIKKTFEEFYLIAPIEAMDFSIAATELIFYLHNTSYVGNIISVYQFECTYRKIMILKNAEA